MERLQAAAFGIRLHDGPVHQSRAPGHKDSDVNAQDWCLPSNVASVANKQVLLVCRQSWRIHQKWLNTLAQVVIELTLAGLPQFACGKRISASSRICSFLEQISLLASILRELGVTIFRSRGCMRMGCMAAPSATADDAMVKSPTIRFPTHHRWRWGYPAVRPSFNLVLPGMGYSRSCWTVCPCIQSISMQMRPLLPRLTVRPLGERPCAELNTCTVMPQCEC